MKQRQEPRATTTTTTIIIAMRERGALKELFLRTICAQLDQKLCSNYNCCSAGDRSN